MGLDITAYRRLKKLDVLFNANEEPVDPSTREPLDYHNCTQLYVHDDFPGRNGSIEHKGVYAFEQSHSFRAGSYSGYNAWRERLAKLAGYPMRPYNRYGVTTEMRHDAAAWAGDCQGMPFVELVNFSDCEGTIGPEVSAKLAKDFADFDERAKEVQEEWFYDRYCEWRKAFEMAADGGAVRFH